MLREILSPKPKPNCALFLSGGGGLGGDEFRTTLCDFLWSFSLERITLMNYSRSWSGNCCECLICCRIVDLSTVAEIGLMSAGSLSFWALAAALPPAIDS